MSPSSSVSLLRTVILFLAVLIVVIDVSLTANGLSFWSETFIVIAFDELAWGEPLSVATKFIE